MIYLVSNQLQLFDTEDYKRLELEECLKILNSWEEIQFDSETSGRDPHICDFLCVQFGNDAADMQIVVDTTTIDILLFKPILETKLIIAQNGKFDLQFCFKYGIIIRNIWDTMVIEQLLHLGYDNKIFHYGLQDIGLRRLGIDIDKSTRGEIIWRGLDSKVIIYAAGDVTYLEKIKSQQVEECKKQGLLKAADLENKFVPVMAYLEWCGIRLDIDKWKIKMQDNENKKNASLEELNNWVVNKYKSNSWKVHPEDEYYLIEEYHNSKRIKYNLGEYLIPDLKTAKVINCDFRNTKTYCKATEIFPFVETNIQGDLFSGFDLEPKCSINWDSPKQTIKFFKYLGFDVSSEDKKTGEKTESVAEKVIAKQKGIADDFLKYYLKYKEASKECSTYGSTYIDSINPITGRIHTTFYQLGCASGRMSCGSKKANTDLAKYKHISPSRCIYPQLQNLPSDHTTRSSFIPNDGNLMTSCDYSALESRLGADIYNEQAMLHEYLEGSGDIHSLTAKICFPKELDGIDVKDIKELRPDLRKKAKGPESIKKLKFLFAFTCLL